jgi:hypothetical protein
LHVWRVDLQLRVSRIALFLILFLHLAAAQAVLAAAVPGWLQALLLSGLALLLAAALRHERSRAGTVLREQATGWWLETAAGAHAAELVRSQVWRWLVVMEFRWRDGSRLRRCRIAVLPDAVPAAAFRRLRVRLRHGPPPPAGLE